MSRYEPKPIETGHVNIDPRMQDLVEKLAENAHDNWARQRMSEGWVHGPKRDDDKLTHPGLVPYAELSESEKEYDRITAMETVKAIIALGYDISGKRG